MSVRRSLNQYSSFLDVYFKNIRTTSAFYSPRPNAQGLLKRLFFYLIKAFNPPRPKAIKKPYSWILDPYLRYLRDECELSEVTIQRACMQVGSFLEALRQRVSLNLAEQDRTLKVELARQRAKAQKQQQKDRLRAIM
jgi:hypothetical protein